MQFQTLASLLAITSIAIAQDLSQVPKCAITPALAAFGKTGCNISDIKCICSASNLVSDLESSIAKVCSAQDLATANAFAVSECQKAGVTLTIPGYSAGSSGSSSAAGSSSTASAGSMSASSSAASSKTASASAAATMSSMSSQASSISVSATSAAGQTASSASTSATPGAANTIHVGGSVMFGAIMAAFAL